MEIFADFGLFELAAASLLALVGRAVFARRWLGYAFGAASVAAPLALVFLVHEGWTRWIAAVALATAVVNAWVLGSLLRRGLLASLLDRTGGGSPSGQGGQGT
jgi:hypothetical protein